MNADVKEFYQCESVASSLPAQLRFSGYRCESVFIRGFPHPASHNLALAVPFVDPAGGTRIVTGVIFTPDLGSALAIAACIEARYFFCASARASRAAFTSGSPWTFWKAAEFSG